MLIELRVKDFAIIEELRLELASGFTVITGETGAGKSILVDALELILGGRAQTIQVRTGVEEAVVEALFLLPPDSPIPDRLREQGLEPEEGGELVLRRVISRSGRHRAFVNGSAVTASMLQRIATDLVDISSQHEHQSLLRADAARQALDAFAGLEAEVAAMGLAHREFCRIRQEADALAAAARERENRLAFLRFQLDELDRCDPQPGEDQTLREERERLRHAARLIEGAARGLALIYEDDDSLVARLGQTQSWLEPLSRIDGRLGPVLEQLGTARIALDDAAQELRSYANGLELDPQRAAEVEERLHTLEHLLRKHGPSLTELLARREEMLAEARTLTGLDERREELEAAQAQARTQLQHRAALLSQARQQAATRFARSVEQELAGLGMPRATFTVALEPLPEPGEQGGETVELLFGPNPGEEVRPLRRIASGGELSRVMLAIRRVVTAQDRIPTHLYDEVDTGVSGPVAEAIGRLLREAARHRQVLCITHHPQVAAAGHNHLRVSKTVRADGRTVSRVDLLDPHGRTEELARMLGGAIITPATLLHAQELLGKRNEERGTGSEGEP